MATPIKFGTDGWRAIIAQDYTFDNLARVAQATALWLRQQSSTPSVMIGYDCRFLGRQFAEAVANQLGQAGIKVFLSPGVASTPMVSLATAQRQCTVGVVITASHNPAEYSGYKLKGYYGGPLHPEGIAEVEAMIPDAAPVVADRLNELLDSRQVEYYDMEALYLNHLRQNFDLAAIKASGIKVGYDAMYGAGLTIAPRIFPGAELLHCTMNPGFDGQAPEPIARNLEPFKQLILEKGLQFGLATDGDADRIGLFDENGYFVDSHHIMLLLIHYLCHTKGMKGKVVYTFSCTSRLARLCDHYGLPYQITKIGFKYIGKIMVAENVLVGGEESGGIAIAGHVPERDGIYIGLTLLELMAKTGKTLPQLVQDVYAITGSFAVERYDLHITEAQKQAVLAACKGGQYASFGSWNVQKTEDMDGFKYHFEGGRWVLIRPSGTEPVLRVYAEAEDSATAFAMLDEVKATLLG